MATNSEDEIVAVPEPAVQGLSEKRTMNENMQQKLGNILIIDDELGPRESIRIVLGGEYNCHLAQDGEEGIEVLKKTPMDLVVLDIKMPKIDGIETLKRIKEVDPEVMVVLLTGYGTLETAQKAIRLGAFDYLKKPFDIEELREVVKKGLEKKTEHEIEKAHVDDLEKVISKMKREMSNFDRMSKLGSLSAGIVHEMKNPLTVILGYTQMILSSVKQSSDSDSIKLSPKSMDYLNVIERETMHCADIAKNLLTVSRESSDEFVKTDMHEIIANTEVLIQPQCSVNQITVAKELADGPVYAQIIQSNVHDILLNLCMNAIYATSKGGQIRFRTVIADKRGTQLSDITEEERDYLDRQTNESFVAIEIHDTGCGIPEDSRSRIFEPFFSTKDGESGTGLGLPVSKEKAEKNSGNLSLVRTGPEGTTFRLLLPMA
jgi:signal transduction histidine kinase